MSAPKNGYQTRNRSSKAYAQMEKKIDGIVARLTTKEEVEKWLKEVCRHDDGYFSVRDALATIMNVDNVDVIMQVF